jgi:hypothetical protein
VAQAFVLNPTRLRTVINLVFADPRLRQSLRKGLMAN